MTGAEDMAPILRDSIEAAKLRHPSATPVNTYTKTLNAHDRCDSCGAAAAYRMEKGAMELDFCLHHWRKVSPTLFGQAWKVTAGNAGLLAALEGGTPS